MHNPIIPIEDFALHAHGVVRPEDVAIAPDGRAWASDLPSGIALVGGSDLLRRGDLRGMPNGLNFLASGEVLIADFAGGLHWLDVESGRTLNTLDSVDGHPLMKTNYVLADAAGFIWATESTRRQEFGSEDVPDIAQASDGWLFVRRPDGSSEVVAEGLCFANGLAISSDGRWLYVAESFNSTVRRAEILRGGSLGPLEHVCTIESATIPSVDSPTSSIPTVGPILDGLGFDLHGNLWITIVSSAAILMIDVDGAQRLVAFDPTSTVLDTPTNVTWGGADRRTLYVGSATRASVATTTVDVPGAPQPWQILTPASR